MRILKHIQTQLYYLLKVYLNPHYFIYKYIRYMYPKQFTNVLPSVRLSFIFKKFKTFQNSSMIFATFIRISLSFLYMYKKNISLAIIWYIHIWNILILNFLLMSVRQSVFQWINVFFNIKPFKIFSFFNVSKNLVIILNWIK